MEVRERCVWNSGAAHLHLTLLVLPMLLVLVGVLMCVHYTRGVYYFYPT
jgi:cytochrome b561